MRNVQIIFPLGRYVVWNKFRINKYVTTLTRLQAYYNSLISTLSDLNTSIYAYAVGQAMSYLPTLPEWPI
jgi:hypothetical protein